MIRLAQTRGGFRVAAKLVMVFWLIGAIMMVYREVRRIPTSLTCDHVEGRCTLREDRHVTEIPLTSLTGAAIVGDGDITRARLELDGTPSARVFCGSQGDPAAAAEARALVDAVVAFRADASHPAISASCTGRHVGGPRPAVPLLASLLGWAFVLFQTHRFSEEIEVLFDRRARTLTVEGRAWFRRRWFVHRGLAEVGSIDLRSYPLPRGQRGYRVFAVFKDGSEALLWTPASVLLTTLEARVAAMRAFLQS